ncbi:MAG: hypothetical protein QGH20_11040, partial [Candidatus Latescibacteria bacterium]|nr:hypothetical protein [Candidatus Latescibacterota bacterium]
MHSSRSLAITQSWTTDSNMVMQGSAISADLDGRGGSQFLTAAYQAIIAFAPSGEELWRFDTDVRFMTC